MRSSEPGGQVVVPERPGLPAEGGVNGDVVAAWQIREPIFAEQECIVVVVSVGRVIVADDPLETEIPFCRSRREFAIRGPSQLLLKPSFECDIVAVHGFKG